MLNSSDIGLTSWFKYTFMYGGLVLLQNLKYIELIICLKPSLSGSQLICLNSLCPICTQLFKFRQNRMHLFWSICNLTLIFCLSWDTKLNKCNQNRVVSESYKAIYEEVETRTCFFNIKI